MRKTIDIGQKQCINTKAGNLIKNTVATRKLVSMKKYTYEKIPIY